MFPVQQLVAACQFYRNASACAWRGKFLACKISRNRNIYESSSALTLCVLGCAPATTSRHGSTCNKSCTCMACQSGGILSGTADLITVRRP